MSVDHWKKRHGQPLGHDPPVEYHCPSCTKRRFYLQVLLRQNKAILKVLHLPQSHPAWCSKFIWIFWCKSWLRCIGNCQRISNIGTSLLILQVNAVLERGIQQHLPCAWLQAEVMEKIKKSLINKRYVTALPWSLHHALKRVKALSSILGNSVETLEMPRFAKRGRNFLNNRYIWRTFLICQCLEHETPTNTRCPLNNVESVLEQSAAGMNTAFELWLLLRQCIWITPAQSWLIPSYMKNRCRVMAPPAGGGFLCQMRLLRDYLMSKWEMYQWKKYKHPTQPTSLSTSLLIILVQTTGRCIGPPH